MLSNQLEELGLTKKEAKIYLAALELGETSIERIAKKAGIKRTTIYGLLDILREKGLVGISKRKNKNLYYAKDPKKLEAQMKQKVKIIEEIMPQLLSITNIMDKKPKVKFFEGSEEIKEIYNDTLNFPDQEIQMWISEKAFDQYDNSFWYDFYMPERFRKRIWIRTIVTDSEVTRKFKLDDPKELRKTKISTTRFIEAEITLYGGKNVSVISFEEMMGLIIESKKLYNTLKGLFEVHWGSIGA